MKIKKIAVVIISSIMVTTMGVGAYANTQIQESQIEKAATDPQIEKIQNQTQINIEKWNALSQAEKDQIKDLSEKSQEVLKKIVKNYLAKEQNNKEETKENQVQINP